MKVFNFALILPFRAKIAELRKYISMFHNSLFTIICLFLNLILGFLINNFELFLFYFNLFLENKLQFASD